MPIRLENKGLYPKNWPEIRAAVLKRAYNTCEFCHVPNHWKIYRDGQNQWHAINPNCGGDKFYIDHEGNPRKIVRIVLTIAHLNHQPTDCRLENLAALCQRCHNRHDIADRLAGRRRRAREASACGDLFLS